jgi:hypothetical protein
MKTYLIHYKIRNIKARSMKDFISIVFMGFIFIQCSTAQPKNDLDLAPKSCRLEKASQTSDSKKPFDPMMVAIFQEDIQKGRDFIQSGHKLDTKDALGFSYLHLATGVGNLESIQIFIKKGKKNDRKF